MNLININGTRDEEVTQAICKLQSEIKNNIASAQAYFICTINNLA